MMQTDVAISLLYERIVMLEQAYNRERDRADGVTAALERALDLVMTLPRDRWQNARLIEILDAALARKEEPTP